jgi:hypothetical protein
MSWLGFGMVPGAMTNPQAGRMIANALPVVVPSAAWTGAPGSGFASLPVDPVRTTAKPALRPLVPPNQRFTDTLRYGVLAFAVNDGSLIDGIEAVRFHFEGTVVDVAKPTLERFTRHDGSPYLLLGYWVNLARPATTSGAAELYIEAIPRDRTMQRRVLGPARFFPETTLYDAEYTIDPAVAVSATNFHSFDAAIARIKSDAPANPRVTFRQAMANVEINVAAPSFAPQGYLTVEALAPVTFGRPTLGTGADVDTASNLRSRLDGMWFRGTNITIDFAHVNQFANEGVRDNVFEQVRLTNSRGATALWRGGPWWSGQRVAGNPWFMECDVTDLDNFAIQASLARGCTMARISRDIYANTLCAAGTVLTRHNIEHLSNDTPAMTVRYSGSASSATVARSGSVDPTSTTYTFAWGANVATFVTGRNATNYAGTIGDGYWFDDLVDWINTVLAAQDSGWSATLDLPARSRRASSGSLATLKAQGFGPTDCKATPLQIVSSFDSHGDWWQHRFNGITENVIAYGNIARDMQTQNIFIGANVDANDFVFVNNAFHNSDSPTSDYYDPRDASSQLGRSTSPIRLSHVVLAHNTLANQGLIFRDESQPATTFDSYCLIANNVMIDLTQAGGSAIGAVVRNNHVHNAARLIPMAVGTTSGGDASTLFVDAAGGDFTPAGALLTNTAEAVVALALDGVRFDTSLVKVGAKARAAG